MRVLGISGIRSDYDLMSMLYRRLARDAELDFRLLVCGAHLSKTYGYSVRLIREDGVPILTTIESLIDADSTSSRLKSASIMLQSAVDAVAQWKPDLILYAGDREEVLMGATIGAYLEIPTVHFYAGDQIDTGHVDNAIRHATSKLSTYHVVPIEEHRSRLLAIGEPAFRISVVGSMALDNFVAEKALSREELKARIGLPSTMRDYALVLFHPEPTERERAAEIFRDMLLELEAAGLGACIGYPNTDPANKEIIASFDAFKDDARFFFYRNLGRSEFISLYKGASLIIGNSSSGIVEAASIPIPSITVGARQRGRHRAGNVLDASAHRDDIGAAIRKSLSPEFLAGIRGMVNPYGDGRSTERAYRILRNTDFKVLRLKTEDPLTLRGGTA